MLQRRSSSLLCRVLLKHRRRCRTSAAIPRRPEACLAWLTPPPSYPLAPNLSASTSSFLSPKATGNLVSRHSATLTSSYRRPAMFFFRKWIKIRSLHLLMDVHSPTMLSPPTLQHQEPSTPLPKDHRHAIAHCHHRPDNPLPQSLPRRWPYSMTSPYHGDPASELVALSSSWCPRCVSSCLLVAGDPYSPCATDVGLRRRLRGCRVGPPQPCVPVWLPVSALVPRMDRTHVSRTLSLFVDRVITSFNRITNFNNS